LDPTTDPVHIGDVIGRNARTKSSTGKTLSDSSERFLQEIYEPWRTRRKDTTSERVPYTNSFTDSCKEAHASAQGLYSHTAAGQRLTTSPLEARATPFGGCFATDRTSPF